MKKEKKLKNKCSLGDLIVALFEESGKVTSNRVEQRFLVATALKDLIDHKIQSPHSLAIVR